MRFLLFLVLFVVMGLPAGLAHAETRFFSQLNDIPLMPGLYEVPEDGLEFDKPEGRIVEAKAVAETKKVNEIRGFYEGVLPQLGWVRASENRYTRGRESLILDLEEHKGLSILSLHLGPAGTR